MLKTNGDLVGMACILESWYRLWRSTMRRSEPIALGVQISFSFSDPTTVVVLYIRTYIVRQNKL